MGRSEQLICGLFVIALAVSCTLTRDDGVACKSNADCRAAFGSGNACLPSGLCEPTPINARCATTFPPDLLTRPGSYPGIVTIGSIMDRAVESQRDREAAIRLATAQVNETTSPSGKGLDGHLFGVVFCDISEDAKYDSLKRADAALATGRYLADSVGVPAIVGPSASGDAIAVFDEVKGFGPIIVSPSASSPELTGHDTKTPTDAAPGLLWRTVAPDTLQGAAIARYLTTSMPTATNVVVVNEAGPYGGSLADVFTAAFQTGPRKVRAIAFGTAAERDAAINDAVSTDAPLVKPNVVLFFSSQTADAVSFLNAAQNLRSYDGVQIFLTDSAANPDLLSGASAAKLLFPRVIGSRPEVPTGTTFDLFKTSYSAAFKKDPSALGFAPQAYDATWLVFYGSAYALRQEKAITGTGIARGLRKISGDGTPIAVAPASFAQIANAVGANQSVNLRGASGNLDYDPTTEETSSLIDIWKISTDGAAIESVTTIDPSAP